jgi:hypothetical protein
MMSFVLRTAEPNSSRRALRHEVAGDADHEKVAKRLIKRQFQPDVGICASKDRGEGSLLDCSVGPVRGKITLVRLALASTSNFSATSVVSADRTG